MTQERMPAIFVGHGSPMIALENNSLTRGFAEMGKRMIDTCGRPKAILAISGHWTSFANLVQKARQPKQIYDSWQRQRGAQPAPG